MEILVLVDNKIAKLIEKIGDNVLVRMENGEILWFKEYCVTYLTKDNFVNGITLLINLWIEDINLMEENYIKNYLFQICEISKLKAIPESFNLIKIPSKKDSNLFGISAYLPILESHICIDTWIENKYIRIELSSCKIDINYEKIINFTKEYFKTDKINYKILKWI